MSEKLPAEKGEVLPALTSQEADDLAGLEAVIASAVKAAGKIAGEALSEIRERRLYRSTHRSWEAYVLDRCGFSVSTANRMIRVAEAKALDTEVGRGDPELPARSRASRRARPDPEPSQREASRRLSDAREPEQAAPGDGRYMRPPAPDGPGPGPRSAAPASAEEPTTTSGVLRCGAPGQRPDGEAAAAGVERLMRPERPTQPCRRCGGPGRDPSPAVVKRATEPKQTGKCQPKCSPNRVVGGTCMACGSKGR